MVTASNLFEVFWIILFIHKRRVIPDKNSILQLSQYMPKFQPSLCNIIIKNDYLPGTKQPKCKYKIHLSNVSFQSIADLYCHFSLHFRNTVSNYITNFHQFYNA